jgi:hypothetical protein
MPQPPTKPNKNGDRSWNTSNNETGNEEEAHPDFNMDYDYDLSSDVLSGSDVETTQTQTANSLLKASALFNKDENDMTSHLKKIRIRRNSNFSNSLKIMTRNNSNSSNLSGKPVKPPVIHLHDSENQKSMKSKLGGLFGEESITTAAKQIQPEDRKRHSLSRDSHDSNKNTDATLAIQFMNTGLRYEKTGDYSNAVRNYRKAYTLRMHKYGDDHDYTKQSLHDLKEAEANLAKQKQDKGEETSIISHASRPVSMKLKSRIEGFEEEVQMQINPHMSRLQALNTANSKRPKPPPPPSRPAPPSPANPNPNLLDRKRPPPPPPPPRNGSHNSRQETISRLRVHGRVDKEEVNDVDKNSSSISNREPDSKPPSRALEIGRRIHHGQQGLDNLTNDSVSGRTQRVNSNRNQGVRRQSRVVASRHIKNFVNDEEPSINDGNGNNGEDGEDGEDDYALFGNMKDDFLNSNPLGRNKK